MHYYLAVIFLFKCLSLLSFASSDEVRLLRDQSPRPNFVYLTLNGVDEVKVRLPDGAAYGRVSLVDEGENEPEFQLSRGRVTAGRRLWRAWPFNRRKSTEDEKEDDEQDQTRMDEYGRPLYHLKSVEITARSGPHSPRCILTGHLPPHDKDLKVEEGESGLRQKWARSWTKQWTQAYSYEQKARRIHDEWVSDVWCVTHSIDTIKILAEISPQRPNATDLPKTASPSPAVATTAAAKKQDDEGASSTFKVFELRYMLYDDTILFPYAFLKLEPDKDDSIGLPVKKAVLMYQTRVFLSLVCRPILYDGWPPHPFYQGPPFHFVDGFIPGAAHDPLTYAFYCDNRETAYMYKQRSFLTGWSPDWTTALGP